MISAKELMQRKDRVKMTAFLFFKERGVDKVSFRDVALVAGVGEASMYRYYKSKSELLQDIQQFMWLTISNEMEQTISKMAEYQNVCGYRQIELLLLAFETILVENIAYMKFALDCRLYWGRHAWKMEQAVYVSTVGLVSSLFVEAVRRGQQDKSIFIQKDVETTSFLLWSIMRAYVDQIVILDGFYAGENRYRQQFHLMKEMVLRAIQQENELEITKGGNVWKEQ